MNIRKYSWKLIDFLVLNFFINILIQKEIEWTIRKYYVQHKKIERCNYEPQDYILLEKNHTLNYFLTYLPVYS